MQTRMKLNGAKWGGRREGAGRIRIRLPLHVNFKYRTGIRNKTTLKLLKKAIQNARGQGLKVLQYSFQHNHVHLLIEAHDNHILSKGMRSLTITFAKGLRIGRVQVERYHLHVLKTVREVRHAIHYVLFNQQKHERGTYSWIDDYSSVLSNPNELDLVRKFAQKSGMLLKVSKGDPWKPDLSGSYIYRRAWSQA